MCLVASALALLGVAGLSLRVCERLGVSPPVRHAAVLLVTFGSGLFHYGTYDAAFSHIYSALGAAVLLWIAVAAVQDRAGRLPLLLTPFVVAVLLLVRNTNVVTVALWSLGLFVWGWRHGVRPVNCWIRNGAIVALGVGLGAGVQLFLNYNAFGRFQLSSYGSETFDFTRFMLPEVLFSFNRGLFVYYPIVGVALVAGLAVRRTRMLATGVALVVLAYGTLYGFWWTWELGSGFGHRGFVDMLPLVIPVLALALDRLCDRNRQVVFSAGCVAATVTMLVMVAYWRGTYPFCDATRHQYADAVTLTLYGRVYKLVEGVPPPPWKRIPRRGRASSVVDASGGDPARVRSRGRTE
jgi:hypothetical protein